ncbi:Deoxyhypusine hydroxylase-B-like protein [Drosera capensis]
MESFLLSYGFIGFVDGSIISSPMHLLQASSAPVLNPDYFQWQRIDHMVRSLLFVTLSRDILVKVLNLKFVREIWDRFHQRFTSVCMASSMELKRKLTSLRKASSDFMEKYLRDIKILADSLVAINSPVFNADLWFGDADWVGCPDSARSTIGFAIYLDSNLISWQDKKQSTVSKFFTEAEYRIVAYTVADTLLIRFLLAELGFPLVKPVRLFCDNVSASYLALNSALHARSKHVAVDYHFVRDRVAYVLGQLQHKAASVVLTTVLKDVTEHPMVRHEAAEALGSIADDQCVALLEEFAKDPEPIVSQSCEVALSMLESESSGKAFEFLFMQTPFPGLENLRLAFRPTLGLAGWVLY